MHMDENVRRHPFWGEVSCHQNEPPNGQANGLWKCLFAHFWSFFWKCRPSSLFFFTLGKWAICVAFLCFGRFWWIFLGIWCLWGKHSFFLVRRSVTGVAAPFDRAACGTTKNAFPAFFILRLVFCISFHHVVFSMKMCHPKGLGIFFSFQHRVAGTQMLSIFFHVLFLKFQHRKKLLFLRSFRNFQTSSCKII